LRQAVAQDAVPEPDEHAMPELVRAWGEALRYEGESARNAWFVVLVVLAVLFCIFAVGALGNALSKRLKLRKNAPARLRQREAHP
jgi:hypothetical protein